ncbi:MAG: hypothetical protein QW568_03180 [Candidatus Anstonellaceae archaeon]
MPKPQISSAIFQLYTPLTQFHLVQLPPERRAEAIRAMHLALARQFISEKNERGMALLLERGYPETPIMVEMCRAANWNKPLDIVVQVSAQKTIEEAEKKKRSFVGISKYDRSHAVAPGRRKIPR